MARVVTSNVVFNLGIMKELQPRIISLAHRVDIDPYFLVFALLPVEKSANQESIDPGLQSRDLGIELSLRLPYLSLISEIPHRKVASLLVDEHLPIIDDTRVMQSVYAFRAPPAQHVQRRFLAVKKELERNRLVKSQVAFIPESGKLVCFDHIAIVASR